VEKVKDYYIKASGVIHGLKGRREEFESKVKEIDELAKDIPSLL
jgi:hypothetical protein